jgi:hypothetical protein
MAQIRKIISWFLLFVVALYIITGYGITQYQLVERITFGVLDKARSFQLHNLLIYPFVPLLIYHIWIRIPSLKKPKKEQ